MQDDLVRVVCLHEQLRAMYGAGLVTDPRYAKAHSLMSKLSRELGGASFPLSQSSLDAMVEKYKDLPEHFAFDLNIGVSC